MSARAKLLDMLRRPLAVIGAARKRPKPPTGELPETPRYDRVPAHPSVGLEPQRLTNILREAEDGDVRTQVELFEDVLEKDLTVSAVRQVRQLGVALCDYELVPVDSSDKAKAQVDFIQDVIDNLSSDELTAHRADFLNFHDLRLALLDSTGKGFAAPVLNWDIDGRYWRVVSAKAMNQRHFIFGKRGDERYDPFDIRIRTEEEPMDGIPLPPNRFLTMYHKGLSAFPARAGLLRGTAWYYLFKNFGFKAFVMYAELFGIPMRVGKYDPANPADKEILQQAVLNLGQDFAAVVSKGSDIEILDHMKAGSSDVHQQLITACNAEITKGWLGQTATTEATPGKLGNEDAKDQVRADIKKADALALQSTIQARFITPLCRFNFGDVQVRFEIRYEEEEDLDAQSIMLQRVARIAPIPLSYVYDKFQIPAPREGEATTVAHLTPGGGAMRVALAAEAGKKKAMTRRNKSDAALAALDAESATLAEQLVPLYERLLAGAQSLDAAAMETALRKALPEFKDAVHGKLAPVLERANAIATEALAPPPAVAAVIDVDFSLPDTEALDWIRWQAFTVAEIEGESITEELIRIIKASIERAVGDGTPVKDFVAQVLDAAGVGKVHRWHLNTVVNNNVSTAHSASTLFAFERNKKWFPGWEFLAVLDNSTRIAHRELHGKKFAYGDWRYWPPIDHNCRCKGSPIDAIEWEDEGYTFDDVPGDGASPEFKNNAVENFTAWVRERGKTLPAESQRAIEQRSPAKGKKK